LIATTTVFFGPLIYKANQELIDEQLKQVSDIINAQTAQLRTVAQKQAEQATQLTKEYVGDYSAKAQALIKGARQPEHKPAQKPIIKEDDFPAAPKEVFPAAPTDDFKAVESEPEVKPHQEPLVTF